VTDDADDAYRIPIDVDHLRACLNVSPLAAHVDAIIDATNAVITDRRHGDLPRWKAGLNALPTRQDVDDLVLELNADTVAARFSTAGLFDNEENLSDRLKRLSPWRKGPFQIGDVFIDTEWRSDWKWQRIKEALSPLKDRCVLDVGCGNGYHLWRLKAAGAHTVLGVDPSALFVIQFLAMQRYVQDATVNLLPLTMEQFKAADAFDTVLSMGVLSHRRDPMEHLKQLKDCLKPGGELLLETLVLPGDKNQVMNIEGRYARMRNVWQLPSTARVQDWLADVGFSDSRLVSSSDTSTDEQRTTEWMPFESLSEALDPTERSLTIEGHPRPCRAVFVATL